MQRVALEKSLSYFAGVIFTWIWVALQGVNKSEIIIDFFFLESVE